MITRPCQIREIHHLIEEYSQSLSSPFDSFLEDHIAASSFYVFEEGAASVGYYAIHNSETLTQFYIIRAYQKHSQRLFSEVLERNTLTSLLVPTCDELFLSLALDKDFKIDKQAYFFQDGQVEQSESKGTGDESFRLADFGDLPQIEQVCGDFLDDYERRIRNGELFTYYRDTLLLGVGVMESSKMIAGVASIGMFTNEQMRKQGVGRNIILHLKKWCYEHNLTPICGCWYYNEASKLTLESAGMVTKTRLLNIKVN
ncbi:N-acetyltransferase [Paenibacillus sp. CF384]|uniref:N-acetyltransferase n=1 Tax=Paenibacillus sp. CF384 TaxID=1884382 RepID=UPI0008977E75|nr:N-acetyltransferase [Paenibacillus sp. CF384]SDX82527.1 hypothetical protein SAMN05518855_102350 [Paenibacillus sp. CF384]